MKKTLALILVTSSIFAKNINYNEAVEIALKNNIDFKLKQLEVEQKKEILNEATSLDFGKLFLENSSYYTNHAGYAFNSKVSSRVATFKDFGLSDFLTSQSLNIAPKDLNYPKNEFNNDFSINYEYPLFTGFKIENAKEIASLQIKARETLLKQDENMLVLEVLKAYNGAVAAKYFISALNKALEATKSHVELSTNFFNEGIVTNIDVLQAKDMEANVNAKLIEAKNRYNLAIAYLKFLLQDENIDGVDEFSTLNCSSGKLEELKKMAIENRTDLEWIKLNEKSSQKMVEMEKSSNYPIIGLNAKYGFNDDKPTLSSDKDYYMVGVGLKYTIFDGGFSKAKIDQAKISYKQTILQRENLESFIKFEVEKNFRDLNAKKEILIEKMKSKELAEEILEKHQLMYKNSIINMTELLLKEADAQKARAEYIEAKYDEMIASANLAISLGYKMKEKR